jgi:hypothetical protein
MGRGLLYARFLAYAAVIALGALHFVHRGDSAADAKLAPPAHLLTGRTRYGMARVGVYRGRARSVVVTVRDDCKNSVGLARPIGFVDAYPGDFARRDRRFADSWSEYYPYGRDTVRVNARMSGVLSRDGTRASGHVGDVQVFLRHGRVVDVCTSRVTWSARG